MPKTRTRVAHVAFTNHRIDIHQASIQDVSGNPPDVLVPLQDLTRLSQLDRELSFGLAMLNVYLRRAGEGIGIPFREQAKRSLNLVKRAKLPDSRISAGLALIALDEGDLTTAKREAQAALEIPSASPEVRWDALEVLAEVEMTNNRYEEAARWLVELTANHRSFRHWMMLGHCRWREKRIPEAVKAFERAIEIAPAEAAAVHLALAGIDEELGDSGQQHKHEELSRVLSDFVP